MAPVLGRNLGGESDCLRHLRGSSHWRFLQFGDRVGGRHAEWRPAHPHSGGGGADATCPASVGVRSPSSAWLPSESGWQPKLVLDIAMHDATVRAAAQTRQHDQRALANPSACKIRGTGTSDWVRPQAHVRYRIVSPSPLRSLSLRRSP